MHAGARDRAETRFEADDAIERRRPDDGAERLRAQRQRDDAGRYCRRGARRRTARRMPRIPRIDRRSRMPPGEFRRNRLAENRGAETAQPLDHPGIALGNVIAVDRRAVRGRHVRCRDDILDRDGNARQRTRPARGVAREIFERLEPGLDGLRLLQAQTPHIDPAAAGRSRTAAEARGPPRRSAARAFGSVMPAIPSKQDRPGKLAWNASTRQRAARGLFHRQRRFDEFLDDKAL